MRRLIRRQETDDQYWKLMARADQLKANLRAVEAQSRGDGMELTAHPNSLPRRSMLRRAARLSRAWSDDSGSP
jgi:hypothetical protein